MGISVAEHVLNLLDGRKLYLHCTQQGRFEGVINDPTNLLNF